MKKLAAIILLLMFSLLSFGQRGITWISAGIKAGYGGSMLYNSSAFTDNALQYKYYTPAYSYGGRVGFSFNEGAFGIYLEGLSNTWGQDYVVNNNENHSVKLSSMSFGLIMKAMSLGGVYFEFGPQYNVINRLEMDGLVVQTNNVSQYSSLVAGLGYMPVFGNRLEVGLGLRAMVSLGTIMNDFNFFSASPNSTSYANYNTMGVILVPMLEVNYVFAYMGRASCGKFRIMLNK